MTTAFAVKVRDFEGPLDLLLNLIEERKMLVSDVSLSKVADDFLAYLREENTLPLGETAHFLVVSATLLLLKSRSLLPVLLLTEDEEEDIHDLEFRLKLYQAVKTAAKYLPNGDSRIFFGGGTTVAEPMFVPSPDLSKDSIEEAMLRVLESVPKTEKRSEVSVKTVISIEEMMQRLSERIQKALQMTFTEFAGSESDKREVVVSFLAMLELTKRGLVLVEQQRSFGDITMHYSGEPAAPRYD